MITFEQSRQIALKKLIEYRGNDYVDSYKEQITLSYTPSPRSGKYIINFCLGFEDNDDSIFQRDGSIVIDESRPWDGMTSISVDSETGEPEIIEAF